ncbi:MAG: hypothetical protein ACOH5I_18845 [Oligoflexus sp.]
MKYEGILRQHARKSMLWASLLGAIGLGLISIGSAKLDWLAGLVYLPLLLIMLFTLIALLTNKSSESNLFRYLADIHALFAISGATMLVIRADMIDFVIKTSPIQYAAIISFPLCFHKRHIGMIRNIILIATSMLSLIIYDLHLASSLYLHYIFGFFAGSIVYVISEDRMYKDFLYKRSSEKERIDSSRRMRHLNAELRSRCLPHQIELIYNGYHYRETMPVYRANFWVSCLSLINIQASEETDLVQKQQIMELNQKMKDRYHQLFHVVRHKTFTHIHPAQELQSSGYYVRCDESRFLVSYDYPFPLDNKLNKGSGIISSLLRQFIICADIMKTETTKAPITATATLAYDCGAGVFTGSLSNYEIEGRVLALAEGYQSVRFQIPAIQNKILAGYLCLIMSTAAYEKIKKDLPKAIKNRIQALRAEPHVRGDSSGKFVYTWFIEPSELLEIHQLIDTQTSKHLRLVA